MAPVGLSLAPGPGGGRIVPGLVRPACRGGPRGRRIHPLSIAPILCSAIIASASACGGTYTQSASSPTADTNADGGRMPSRQQVTSQLAHTTNYAGLTGTYTFGPLGDPTTPTLKILQFKGGSWITVANLTVASS